MSRNFTSEITGAFDDQQVDVFWACDLLFDDPNKLYFWNGIGEVEIDGNTYTGAGDLIGLSELRESSDIAAYGATLTLSGIPNNLIGLALAEPYQGRKALVRFGMIVGGVIYSNIVFSGEMDQMNINFGPSSVDIALEVESRLIDLERARIRRYTDADQRARFPDDAAFSFVTRLQDERLEWQTTAG